MEIIIDKKFTEKHIDYFIDKLFNNIMNNPNDIYKFDLSNTEWISNQNLLLFTSLLKYFVEKKIVFKVHFKKIGVSSNEISDRTKLQIIQLWDIWKIYSVIEQQDYSDYFDITNNTIELFKKELKSKRKYNSSSQEIYNRYGITPFISFNKINDYKDNFLINSEINSIYKLNNVILDQLTTDNCSHPFINNTLSGIITKELYENFLDHFQSSFFNTDKNWSFMSLALKRKTNEDNQILFKRNFDEEELIESENFFLNNNLFRNESIIQFSFLDFGNGIVNTLSNQYCKDNNIVFGDLVSKVDPNEVLKYSFKHNTSQNPIKNWNNDNDLFIPRGLFDLLTIVRRYKGLLIVRSNYGKILYDFSMNQNFEDAYCPFGDNSTYFPGTFFTVYLPALQSNSSFDKSTIKPQQLLFKSNLWNSDSKEKHINIIDLYNKARKDKEFIYNDLLNFLNEELNRDQQIVKTNYVSFLGCDDERIHRKVIFYLLTNYDITSNNSIVILHPPKKELVTIINEEILNLDIVIKNYKIHPIPLIYLTESYDDVEIIWIGVFNENDKSKLNQYLFDNVVLPITDFEDFHNILGNLQCFDDSGNVHSKLPKINTLLKYYKEHENSEILLIENLITKNNCLKEEGLYLCNGDYYQNTFLQLTDLLNKTDQCNQITKLLFNKIKQIPTFSNDVIFLAITSSSHKLLYSLIEQNFIVKENCLFFDSYRAFENDSSANILQSGVKYIFVCDAISGGNLTKRVAKTIEEINSNLIGIAAIANTLDEEFENTKEFLLEFETKIYCLYKYPIKKIKRKEIENKDLLCNVIRINPFTNIPITFSEQSTLQESILLNNNDFCSFLDEEDININFRLFNNLLHPYFFDLKKILTKENTKIASVEKSILGELFKKLESKIEISSNLKIFIPKKSDINFLDFDILKSKVLLNHSIEVYELERFNIDEGWKFPHTTDFYLKIVENNNILIIDDGSCTGDSIVQMINELTSFKPNRIDLLCIIGRINDHKREFFSKISSLRCDFLDSKNSLNYKEVKVNIYFGSHWHISTHYLDNSPYIKETTWLKDLLKIQNIPLSIKSIAEVILKNILPQTTELQDYKYLPVNKSDGFLPKKDIILVRNEIGKIVGHRFYKESFEWFNEFTRKYEKREKTKDRTKEIELLCICIVYEPYLYEKIASLLPDIKEKLEEFIDSIIFGNPNNRNRKINIQTDLHYDWTKNKKDIIHLFFIIYNEDNLLPKLNISTFLDLLEFARDTFQKTNPINYIFYKLLHFFPLNKSDVPLKNNAILLKNFLLNLIESRRLESKDLSELKRYYSFLNTLPNGENIDEQISKIKNIYWEHEQPRIHDNRESFDQNISRIITTLSELKDSCEGGNNLDDEKIKRVKDSWWNIKHIFLDAIIAFYRTFEDFFKPYPYHIILSKLESKNNSLIEMHTFLDDFIFNILQKGNDLNNYNISIEYLDMIQKYFGLESEFRDIFDRSEVALQEFLKSFIDKVNIKFTNAIVKNTCLSDFKIKIPFMYLEKLIMEEILDNLRYYSDFNKNIEINVFKIDNSDIIEINIKNHFTDNIREFSGGEGLNSLKHLSNSSIFNFNYSYNVDNLNKTFYQTLSFNKI